MNNIDSLDSKTVSASFARQRMAAARLLSAPALLHAPSGQKLRALQKLRQDLEKLMPSGLIDARQDRLRHFGLGAPHIDDALRHEEKRSGAKGGPFIKGLPIAALHEIHAAERADASNAAAFTLLMAQRARMTADKNSDAAPILWARVDDDAQQMGHIYPPGIAELGIDPASILYVGAPDIRAALRAAADAAQCAALGAVIVEISGKRPKGFDMTATRRLSLSAQKSGVTIFCLRHDALNSGALNGQIPVMPSAAYSRWQVASAPSNALSANAPGHPVFAIKLLRHRGGMEGLPAQLEWNRDERAFRDAPDFGAVSAVSEVRTDREFIRKRA